jgi:hypothetical protein
MMNQQVKTEHTPQVVDVYTLIHHCIRSYEYIIKTNR